MPPHPLPHPTPCHPNLLTLRFNSHHHSAPLKIQEVEIPRRTTSQAPLCKTNRSDQFNMAVKVCTSRFCTGRLKRYVPEQMQRRAWTRRIKYKVVNNVKTQISPVFKCQRQISSGLSQCLLGQSRQPSQGSVVGSHEHDQSGNEF